MATSRSKATPNRLIVRHADRILGRNGAMIRENKKYLLERYMVGISDEEL